MKRTIFKSYGMLSQEVRLADKKVDELEYCSQCNSRIALNEGEQAFYDDNNNVYCEDCWIQYEATIRGLN